MENEEEKKEPSAKIRLSGSTMVVTATPVKGEASILTP